MILFGLITDTIFLILFIIMMIPGAIMLYTNKNRI